MGDIPVLSEEDYEFMDNFYNTSCNISFFLLQQMDPATEDREDRLCDMEHFKVGPATMLQRA